MKTFKMKRICALLLCLILTMSLLSAAAMAEETAKAKCLPSEPTKVVAKVVETSIGSDGKTTEKTSEYTGLISAVNYANKSDATDVRIEVLSGCTLSETAYLKRAMTIKGVGTSTPTISFRSSKLGFFGLFSTSVYGFWIGTGFRGTYNFDNLIIDSGDAKSCITVFASEEFKKPTVKISNTTLLGASGAAVSLKGSDRKSLDNYFDLSVSGCLINYSKFGIGADQNTLVPTPDMASSTLTVSGTQFNTTGTDCTCCIYLPKILKSIIVTGNTFNQSSTGIDYQFKGTETGVIIKNNDFSYCRTGKNTGNAISATNFVTDLKDSNCYLWATELSGNNLCGQNVLYTGKAQLEVVWFPDGQATNSTIINNIGNSNSTDAGTRYSLSASSSPNALLTDFNITDAGLSFAVGGSALTTTYYYNSPTSSGAYTNAVKGLDYYWTAANNIHCAQKLTNWATANSITRWKLGDSAMTQDKDSKGNTLSTYTSENSVAKVIVDTATGKITVTPKAAGTTVLTATVGGGAKSTLPNAKSDTLAIVVNGYYNPPPYYPPYVPVNPSGAGSPQLNRTTHTAYISGYPDGKVHPEALITRGEIATIFYRLLTDASRQKYMSYNNAFSDVSAGDWYNEAISSLTNAGILKGYPDNTFRPNANVTRGEFTAIVTRFYSELNNSTWDAFTDISKHWARNEINLASQLKLVTGYPDGTFKPDSSVSRAEAITIVNNALGWTTSNSSKYTVRWNDNLNTSVWYYTAVQEATNTY